MKSKINSVLPAPVRDALSRGWSVIPVRSDKKPAIPTWKEYLTEVIGTDREFAGRQPNRKKLPFGP